MSATDTVMAELAAELKKTKPNPKTVERLSRRLDQLLGTELPAEDAEQAEAWERGRRNP
jgi:hypothetical protein